MRAAGVSLAIWQRPSPVVPASLDGFADLRLSAASDDIAPALVAQLVGSAPAEWHDALVTDASMLARRLAAVLGHDRIGLRLDRIAGNACSRFHTDYVPSA